MYIYYRRKLWTPPPHSPSPTAPIRTCAAVCWAFASVLRCAKRVLFCAKINVFICAKLCRHVQTSTGATLSGPVPFYLLYTRLPDTWYNSVRCKFQIITYYFDIFIYDFWRSNKSICHPNQTSQMAQIGDFSRQLFIGEDWKSIHSVSQGSEHGRWRFGGDGLAGSRSTNLSLNLRVALQSIYHFGTLPFKLCACNFWLFRFFDTSSDSSCTNVFIIHIFKYFALFSFLFFVIACVIEILIRLKRFFCYLLS